MRCEPKFRRFIFSAAIFVSALPARAQTTANLNLGLTFECSAADFSAAPLGAQPGELCQTAGPGATLKPEDGHGSEDPSYISRTPEPIGAASPSAASLPDVPVVAARDAISPAADSLPAAPEPAGIPAAQPQTLSDAYEPITGERRFVWIAKATLGYQSLTGGLFSAGLGTALDHPHEYGTHWGGFGARYGMRLTGISTSNAMEAGIGAIWGEDPRYFRERHGSFGAHCRNIVKQVFEARRSDGDFTLAYARYIAITGSNFLSNTWRVNSEADASHALLRTVEGVGIKALGNTWNEFWPLFRLRVRHAANQ